MRSAVFKRQPGQLSYQVLIMRENHAGPAFKGNVTLAIEGNYANGRRGTLTPDPLALDLQRYNNTQGVLPLPDGFTPRSVTIRVLDGQQKQHAMRIYYVRG